jgi:hypothetical protein
MKAFIYVPSSLKEAGAVVRSALACRLDQMSKIEFVRVWSSIAYLFPGLHPDGFENLQSGWPLVLRRFAVEAWRREAAGVLGDEELYPSDAQWAGLYDRMNNHTEIESRRRLELIVLSDKCAHG